MSLITFGLEETNPYSTVTLTNVSQVGNMLAPFKNAVDCSSFTGLTTLVGTRGTSHVIEQDYLKFTLPFEEKGWNLTGDFDIRCDISMVVGLENTGNAGYAVFFRCEQDANNYVQIDLNVNNSWSFRKVIGGTSTNFGSINNVGTTAALIRATKLRLTRSGSNYAAYYWSFNTGWVQIATTQAVSLSSTYIAVGSAPTAGGCQGYFKNLRDAFPVSTGGTYTAVSAATDTTDGLQAIWWENYEPSATGTVTFQVRTASTSGGLSAASWTTVVPGATFTPSAANRWMQWQATWTGLSASSPVPFIGPVLVRSASVAQTDYQNLFKRFYATWRRHEKPGTGQFPVAQLPATTGPNANKNLAYGCRESLGPLSQIAAGTTSVTWKGLTYDLVAGVVSDLDASFAALDDGATTQLTVDTIFFSSGFLEAATNYPTLINSAVTNTQKANWTTHIQNNFTQVNTSSNSNYWGNALVDAAHLAALAALDPGNWATYTDSTLNTTYWTPLQATYLGEGSYNDTSTSGGNVHVHPADLYTLVDATNVSRVAAIRPTWSNATTASGIGTEIYRRHRQAFDVQGSVVRSGRSPHGASYLESSAFLRRTEKSLGITPDGTTRRLVDNATWEFLTEGVHWHLDLPSIVVGKRSQAYDTYTTWTTILASTIAAVGQIAADSALFSPSAATAEPSSMPGFVHAWNSPHVGHHRGTGANDPLFAASFAEADLNGGPSAASEYPQVIVPEEFYPNRGPFINGGPTRPGPTHNALNWRGNSGTSGYDAFNEILLNSPSTSVVRAVGRGFFGYRSGTPTQWGSTHSGTAATGVTQSEAYMVAENRVYQLATLALGAVVPADFMQLNAVNIPLPPSTSSSNASTGGSGANGVWAYQEGQTARSYLSHFLRSLEGPAAPTMNTNILIGLESEATNVRDYQGRTIQANWGVGSYTGTQTVATETAYSRAAMVPATEATYTSNWTSVISGTARTWNDARGGINLMATTAAVTNPTVGNYAITGSGVYAFRGESAPSVLPTWFGGGDLTAITYNGTNLISATSAINITVDTWGPGKFGASSTATSGTIRIQIPIASSASLTVYSGILPAAAGSCKVFVFDLGETLGSGSPTAVDKTSSCTVSGGNITIPSSVAQTYGSRTVIEIQQVTSTVTSVTVSPSTVTLAGATGTQTFTATVNGTGGPSQSVTWSALHGTIDSSGNYTAPASLGGTTDTVTATSVQDGTKSGTATVTVSADVPIVPGTVVLTYSGLNPILTAGSPTGGEGSYTYQWYRHTGSGGFTPGVGNILNNGGGVSGATTLAVTDGSVAANTTYSYILVITDSVGETAQTSLFTLSTTHSGGIGGGGGIGISIGSFGLGGL